MLKTHMAACLVATALVAAPALAQTTTAPASNPPAGSMATMNVNAAEFVNKAANSDMFEIQSSQLALNKTQDNRVRDFAQHMIQDHTQASEKLKAAAQNMSVPTSLDQEHAGMLQQLQQASGNDFTRNYVQMQLMGHQRAVALFDSYAQNGDNPQLKQFAQATAPTLRNHLQQITQIRNDMMGPDRVGQNQGGQAGQMSGQFMTQARPDLWRASKLTGLNVYNNNNEKIGDINEVLVDRDGKAEAVIIGVGGFLGIGEHDVAVPFSALQWAMTDRNAGAGGNAGGAGTGGGNTNAGANRTGAAGTMATTAPSNATTGAGGAGTAGTGGTAGAGGTAGSMTASGNDGSRNYPDHAVLPNASKDQLRNAPQFRYSAR